MRKLSLLWLVVAAALFIGSPATAQGSRPISGVSVQDFTEKFPEAVKDKACYLLKLDNCRVIAVSVPRSYSSRASGYTSARIELIFVNGKTKDKVQEVAKRLANELSPRCKVVPFEQNKPWAAIICPNWDRSRSNLPSVILYRNNGDNVRFMGWQGKLLRAQMEYQLPSDQYNHESPSSTRKKNGKVVEILLDVTSSSLDHVEFRVVKGHIDYDDMIDFIRSFFPRSSSYLPNFSPYEENQVKDKFPRHNLVVYSTSSDFCIANKSRVYHAGTIDGVSSYLRSRHPVVKFDFPDENTAWPVQSTSQPSPAIADAQSTKGPSQSMGSSTPASIPLPSKPPFPSPPPTPPIPLPALTAGNANEQDNARQSGPKTIQEEIAQYVQMLQTL